MCMLSNLCDRRGAAPHARSCIRDWPSRCLSKIYAVFGGGTTLTKIIPYFVRSGGDPTCRLNCVAFSQLTPAGKASSPSSAFLRRFLGPRRFPAGGLLLCAQDSAQGRDWPKARTWRKARRPVPKAREPSRTRRPAELAKHTTTLGQGIVVCAVHLVVIAVSA
jgi:hypothetical protein